MCDICLNTPCIIGCPNKKVYIFGYCHLCGCEIYYGDEYVNLDNKYCIDCVDSNMRTAEY